MTSVKAKNADSALLKKKEQGFRHCQGEPFGEKSNAEVGRTNKPNHEASGVEGKGRRTSGRHVIRGV